MKVLIQYQDQFGRWHPYQSKHNEADAYRTAKQRAKSANNRLRLLNENGNILDLIDP